LNLASKCPSAISLLDAWTQLIKVSKWFQSFWSCLRFSLSLISLGTCHEVWRSSNSPRGLIA
jgi:hypothetical protein